MKVIEKGEIFAENNDFVQKEDSHISSFSKNLQLVQETEYDTVSQLHKKVMDSFPKSLVGRKEANLLLEHLSKFPTCFRARGLCYEIPLVSKKKWADISFDLCNIIALSEELLSTLKKFEDPLWEKFVDFLEYSLKHHLFDKGLFQKIWLEFDLGSNMTSAPNIVLKIHESWRFDPGSIEHVQNTFRLLQDDELREREFAFLEKCDILNYRIDVLLFMLARKEKTKRFRVRVPKNTNFIKLTAFLREVSLRHPIRISEKLYNQLYFLSTSFFLYLGIDEDLSGRLDFVFSRFFHSPDVKEWEELLEHLAQEDLIDPSRKKGLIDFLNTNEDSLSPNSWVKRILQIKIVSSPSTPLYAKAYFGPLNIFNGVKN